MAASTARCSGLTHSLPICRIESIGIAPQNGGQNQLSAARHVLHVHAGHCVAGVSPGRYGRVNQRTQQAEHLAALAGPPWPLPSVADQVIGLVVHRPYQTTLPCGPTMSVGARMGE